MMRPRSIARWFALAGLFVLGAAGLPLATGISAAPPAALGERQPLANVGLDAVNGYRAIAGLPPVTENTTWSAGGWEHSRYMVKNNVIGHSQNPALPFYSAAGNLAAQNGNVMASTDVHATDAYAVLTWMQGPFHALGIIDPKLATSGFGSYREADGGYQMAATLDVLRGRTATPGAFPIFWPGKNTTMPILSYTGGEFPDPLTSCPGYSVPTGPPIIVQFGTGSVTPNVTAHSITRGGTAVEHCLFTETIYANPNASDQSLGRSILNMRDAVVLMPRQPLVAGQVYTISITVNGVAQTWTFTAAGGAAHTPTRTVTVAPHTPTRTVTVAPHTPTRTVTVAPHTPTRTVTVQPGPHTRRYVPITSKGFAVPSAGHISGTATYAGGAAGGQPVALVACNTGGCGPIAQTTTSASGAYDFTGIPSAPAGTTYYIRWENVANDSRFLSQWYGPNIVGYTAGASVHGGNFDIKDVVLTNPATNAVVGLPHEFRWVARGIAGDTYRFVVIEDGTLNPVAQTSLLGAIDHVTITGLPAAVQIGKVYGWYVLVYAGTSNAYGVPFYYRRITFTNRGSGLSELAEPPDDPRPFALPHEQ
ncbi:MAG: CAP domain-containing protein [Dehalococcoidia bacterium]